MAPGGSRLALGGERRWPWGEAPFGKATATSTSVWRRRCRSAPVRAGASALGVQELVGNGWEWTGHPLRARSRASIRCRVTRSTRPTSSTAPTSSCSAGPGPRTRRSSGRASALVPAPLPVRRSRFRRARGRCGGGGVPCSLGQMRSRGTRRNGSTSARPPISASAQSPRSGRARLRSPSSAATAPSPPSPAPATTSAVRSAKGASTATTSSVPGTTGSSTTATGEGEPGFEADRVPSHATKVETGRVLRRRAPPARRATSPPHESHPFSRPVRARARTGADGRDFDDGHGPSEPAVVRLRGSSGARDRACAYGPRLRDPPDPPRRTSFRACEGYYSKSARACTWPCSITQMDSARPTGPGLRGPRPLGRRRPGRDADPLGRRELALLPDGRANELHPEPGHHPRPRPASATRSPASSSSAARTTSRPWPVRCSGFFAELGFLFPQFPYVAHSRGWSRGGHGTATWRSCARATTFGQASRPLVERCAALAGRLMSTEPTAERVVRGGRKAHSLAARE